MLGRLSVLWGPGRRPTRCFLLQKLLTPLLHLLAAPYALRGSFPSKNHHSLVSTPASRNEGLKAWLCFLDAIDADNSTYNHAAWSPISGQSFPISFSFLFCCFCSLTFQSDHRLLKNHFSDCCLSMPQSLNGQMAWPLFSFLDTRVLRRASESRMPGFRLLTCMRKSVLILNNSNKTN